jgi:hypothetical protein
MSKLPASARNPTFKLLQYSLGTAMADARDLVMFGVTRFTLLQS